MADEKRVPHPTGPGTPFQENQEKLGNIHRADPESNPVPAPEPAPETETGDPSQKEGGDDADANATGTIQ